MYNNLNLNYHVQQRNILAKKVDILLQDRNTEINKIQSASNSFTISLARIQLDAININLERCQKAQANHQEYIDSFINQL